MEVHERDIQFALARLGSSDCELPTSSPLCSAELRSSSLDPSQLILEQSHMADKGARDANEARTSTLVGW
jgi:hypothetical protein